MDNSKIINSVNLYAETNFPYLVLNVTGENSYPRNPGFRTVHWHEDLQFIYVLEGTVQINTLSDNITANKGEGVFINKNIIHSVNNPANCHYVSFVFPDYFLKFYFGSPAEQSVNRIVGRSGIPYCKFDGSLPWHHDALEYLKKLYALENDKNEFYSYRVLCLLSSMWSVIQSNVVLTESQRENTENRRMKLFLKFIHRRYAEQITVDDLAKSANVSVSETLRCFKSCMRTTPYKYLTEFRLSKAAALLKDTDEPVGNIADSTGFPQQSHFGKRFKEKTGYSPKEYRNLYRKR